MFLDRLLATILLAGSLQSNSYGGSLREIWKLDLSAAVDGPLHQKAKSVPVYAIRFSPDGQQIAVAVTWYLPGGGFVNNLVVVQTQHPNDNIRKFDIQGIANDYAFQIGSSLPVITWSPSADAIAAGNTIVRLGQGETCELAGWRGPGFIGSNRILVVASPRDHQEFIEGNEPTRFNIFDKDCRLHDSWSLEKQVSIDDISVERGLLYVHEASRNPEPPEELVIDSTSKTTVRTSRGWGSSARFANRGKAICSGRMMSRPFAYSEKLPVRCFDVDTGAIITEASRINIGEPIFAAESATRIITHDVSTVRIPFTGEYGTILRRRVVWDFQTGTEVASWGPSTQAYYIYRNVGPPRHVKEPFRVAISPDGRFIAEGGNGILHLYEIAD